MIINGKIINGKNDQLKLKNIGEGQVFECESTNDTILIKTTDYDIVSGRFCFTCVCLETGIVYMIGETEEVRTVNAKVIIS